MELFKAAAYAVTPAPDGENETRRFVFLFDAVSFSDAEKQIMTYLVKELGCTDVEVTAINKTTVEATAKPQNDYEFLWEAEAVRKVLLDSGKIKKEAFSFFIGANDMQTVRDTVLGFFPDEEVSVTYVKQTTIIDYIEIDAMRELENA
jgi:hypothetical protein